MNHLWRQPTQLLRLLIEAEEDILDHENNPFDTTVEVMERRRLIRLKREQALRRKRRHLYIAFHFRGGKGDGLEYLRALKARK